VAALYLMFVDVCLAFHRRCWAFDLMDRKETRPEIVVFQWQPKHLKWPVNNKEKPDLIFIDPPYFKKKTTWNFSGSFSNYGIIGDVYDFMIFSVIFNLISYRIIGDVYDFMIFSVIFNLISYRSAKEKHKIIDVPIMPIIGRSAFLFVQ
jgi:hypothetical protein